MGNNAEEVVSNLKAITQTLFHWFAQNKMKANLSVISFSVPLMRSTLKYQRQQFVIQTRKSYWE